MGKTAKTADKRAKNTGLGVAAGIFALGTLVGGAAQYELTKREILRIEAEKGPRFAAQYAQGLQNIYRSPAGRIVHYPDIIAAKEYLGVIR